MGTDKKLSRQTNARPRNGARVLSLDVSGLGSIRARAPTKSYVLTSARAQEQALVRTRSAQSNAYNHRRQRSSFCVIAVTAGYEIAVRAQILQFGWEYLQSKVSHFYRKYSHTNSYICKVTAISYPAEFIAHSLSLPRLWYNEGGKKTGAYALASLANALLARHAIGKIAWRVKRASAAREPT